MNEGRDRVARGTPETREGNETKVFTWERAGAAPEARRILLEAAEPAAYDAVKPLIAYLQNDERCRAITLVTDNTAGERFMDEKEVLGLTQMRTSGPVLADISGPFDSVLVVTEPQNSPDKPLLYGGRSVYGNDATRVVYLIDGVLGHATRTQFSNKAAENMDEITTVGVANDFSKQLLEAAVPRLHGRVEVVGSLLLESLKQKLTQDRLIGEEERSEARAALRATLGVASDAVMVLFSGFPSSDYPARAEGSTTLNQETFAQTLQALMSAASANPERTYALAVRAHPRASDADRELAIPATLPSNLSVVQAQTPPYDTVANAVDIIACQSTSTEVLYAPYRGTIAAVSGYTGDGMQGNLNAEIYGSGVEAFKQWSDLLYVDSAETFANYLEQFVGPGPRRAFPPSPTPGIAALLVGEEHA